MKTSVGLTMMEVKNMRRRGRKKGEKKRGGDHNTSAITPVDHVGAALYFQHSLLMHPSAEL